MSVRNRIFLMVGGVLLLLIIVLIITARLILFDGFQHLEEQNVQSNVERVTNAINDEIATLLSTNADWAHWDDTYEFIQDGNEIYIEDNLANETLGNLNLDLVVFVDTDGQIIFSKALDLESWEEIPLPAGIEDYLSVDDQLTAHPDESSATGGILLLPDVPLLVTSQPILTNTSAGPIQGALIFGRVIDDTKVEALSNSLKLMIALEPMDDRLPAEYQAAHDNLVGSSDAFVEPVNANTIAGYSLLQDVAGRPAMLLRVTMDRDIHSQGLRTFWFFIAAMVVIAVVAGVLTTILLDQTVLKRIASLRNDVDQISTTGDLSYRVTVTGQDELSALGSKLNDMLVALDQAQKAQRESDERLRALVNNAPLVIWSTDANGMLTLVEGAEIKNLAVNPAELIGKPASDWADKIPLDEQDLKKALAGNPVTATTQANDLYFDAQYLPVKDQNGQIATVIGVATNITERLTAEEGLKEANQSLDQTNRQLRRTHELLRSTVEQMHDLIRRGSPVSELRGSLEFIQQEFEKLQD